jgi:uncharacterized protein (DUF433 family)
MDCKEWLKELRELLEDYEEITEEEINTIWDEYYDSMVADLTDAEIEKIREELFY